MFSCDLNEDLNDSITKETSNEILGATEGLTTAYNLLRTFQTLDTNFSLQEHTSDEMAGPTRGSDWGDNGVWRELHLHTWRAQNVRLLNAWEGLYKGLAFSIDAQNYKDITPSQKAQALFIQALNTFYLTDLFGQVAMREPGEKTFDNPSTILNRTEAIDYAIALLEKALPNLPDGSAQTAFIASKNAGYGLLAKMYLTEPFIKQQILMECHK
jgi:starch-binding outer membrane protein, SusD/RagB family